MNAQRPRADWSNYPRLHAAAMALYPCPSTNGNWQDNDFVNDLFGDEPSEIVRMAMKRQKLFDDSLRDGYLEPEGEQQPPKQNSEKSRRKKKATPRPGGKSLVVFFGNITSCSEKAVDYIRMMKGIHIAGFAETHHRGGKMQLNSKTLTRSGWVVGNSPAAIKTSDDQGQVVGTSGGTMLCHLPWIKIKAPT